LMQMKLDLCKAEIKGLEGNDAADKWFACVKKINSR